MYRFIIPGIKGPQVIEGDTPTNVLKMILDEQVTENLALDLLRSLYDGNLRVEFLKKDDGKLRTSIGNEGGLP